MKLRRWGGGATWGSDMVMMVKKDVGTNNDEWWRWLRCHFSVFLVLVLLMEMSGIFTNYGEGGGGRGRCWYGW